MEVQDPREWSVEKVVTFVRSSGPAECFSLPEIESRLYLGVDDSVFFVLSLNDLEGVRGHAHEYHRMCEFTHNNTDARASTVVQTDHS